MICWGPRIRIISKGWSLAPWSQGDIVGYLSDNKGLLSFRSEDGSLYEPHFCHASEIEREGGRLWEVLDA